MPGGLHLRFERIARDDQPEMCFFGDRVGHGGMVGMIGGVVVDL